MPLVVSALEGELVTAFKKTFNANKKEENPEVAVTNLAKALAADIATAVDKYIKSGIVNTTVTTAGSAAAQTGVGVGNVT